jgi:purine-binding chemotaxis protein CheW
MHVMSVAVAQDGTDPADQSFPDVNKPSIASDEFALCLLCRVQTRWCALPLRHVIESMRPLPTAPVPGAPSFVDGLAIIRGGPVPVVNLSRLLGLASAQPTRLVCIRTERGRIALAVDHVAGVRAVPSESLHMLPPLLQCVDSQVIAAIGMLDTQLLLVMQFARLMTDDFWDTVPSEATSP